MKLLLPLLWAATAWANTETYLYRVPNYYEVPPHVDNGHGLTRLNASALLITNHPVLTIDNYTLDGTAVTVPYDFAGKPSETLYVRLNNYGNATFDSNDLISVKLCWPATTPLSFRLSHKYVRASEFGLAGRNTLDAYVVVEYEADFYAVAPVADTSFDMHLVVSKLPNGVPIPIELYDVIVFLVDVVIVAVAVLPYIV